MKQIAGMLAIAAILALVLAACGGGEPTPTPRAPAPTVAPPTQPPAAATPTAAPKPTPTPDPSGAIPTPIINRAGKYGGILNVPAVANQPYGFDTYTVQESFAYEVWHPMFNNILWPDPYGDGQTLVGDLASGWEFSEGGKVITISLRKGVSFHDGTPLTSKDVAYNYDRAVLNPRTPTMIYFKPRLRALEKVEALDESAVRLTLSRPSNSAIGVLSMNQWMQYPSSMPFPEKLDEFKKNPIGTGPFKFKSLQQGVRLEVVRNPNYWKPGLPYLDGIVTTPMNSETFLASMRGGRLDLSGFNNRELVPSNVKLLKDATGFVAHPITVGVTQMILNQRTPWTDRRAREALSLAIDRPALVTTWLNGAGSPFASALLPPEVGGQWGISTEVMKTRPGFRTEKTQDIATARRLLVEAGVDTGQLTVKVLTTVGFDAFGTVVEANLRSLGLKTKLDLVDAAEGQLRFKAGDFDAYLNVSSLTFDDPADYLNDWVVTGAGQNSAKWAWPELDRLLDEQDRTQDIVQRKAILIQIQEMMLKETFGAFIPMVFRQAFAGHQPWVKNYYPRLPFLHSPQFRHEQIWLER